MRLGTASLLFSSCCCTFLAGSDAAFISPTNGLMPSKRVQMVGGRGWDNSDYLSGLSGDDEDREKVNEDYDDFSQRRVAFEARQNEIMKTPQGKAFLEKQQQSSMMAGNDFGDDGDDYEDEFANVKPGTGGGSRMAQMMARAQKMQERQAFEMRMGLEQKFAIPLDDDDEKQE
jgi:hypothetical protein